MDFTILADTKFGWLFVISEIILLYALFLVLHRLVRRKLTKRGLTHAGGV